jgi:Fe-S cluster assembly protein SufD
MTDKPIIIKKKSIQISPAQLDLQFSPKISDENRVVRTYRQKSWQKYQSTPLPKGKEEEWRRTSLKSVDFTSFDLITEEKYSKVKFPDKLSEPVAGEKNGGQLLLSPVNSHLRVDDAVTNQGVIFGSLKELVRSQSELIERVLNKVISNSDKFSALAGALDFNGVLLYVPKNVKVDLPLQSVYWAPADGFAHSIHILVYLEEGASVTYVHEAGSPEGTEKDSLHAGVMEIYVGPAAHLNFVELQSWGENVINFTRENVVLDRDGSIDWIFGALGSRLTKNFSNLNLVGQGSTGRMSGFYFTDNEQHLDHDTQQNHLAANTTSDLLFKGALLDTSRSVWQGMIYVAPEATKTDGYQANRNLVLSRDARADSIPGLEILTDDVRCTHGATVGKIDEEQIFYLESRGMPQRQAERLVVEGFFDPIMHRIPFEGVRNRFQDAIQEKMEHIG